MDPLLSAKGVPYLPNEGDAAASPPAKPLPFIVYVLLFFGIFGGLQLAWEQLRNTGAERLMIEVLLVRPAVWLINGFTPQVGAIANGSFIEAAGGGLQVVSACTGTEIYFMLTAAMVAFPLPWRARVIGTGIGLLFVFVLNHARILALFYAYRAAPVVFDYLHSIFIPIVLVLLTALFVLWWTAGHDAAHVTTAGR